MGLMAAWQRRVPQTRNIQLDTCLSPASVGEETEPRVQQQEQGLCEGEATTCLPSYLARAPSWSPRASLR